MIFGDRTAFAFEVDRFEPPWKGFESESNDVWASLAVWIAGDNVAEHRRHGTDRIRDAVHMPLAPLARWFASAGTALRFEERLPVGSLGAPHDQLERWIEAHPALGFDQDSWLELRDAWWSRHFTGSATGDILVPSLGLVRSDDRARISWRVPELPNRDRMFVTPRGATTVPWRVVSSAIDEFVHSVEGWMSADPDRLPIANRDRSALEYYTGLSFAEVEGFEFTPAAVDNPAVDPLAQVIRDLTHRTATGPAKQPIEHFVRHVDGRRGRDWWELRQGLLPTDGTAFEEDGYDAARSVRSQLNLGARPIANMEELARTLDVEIATRTPAAETDRMLVVGAEAGPANTMVLRNARTETPWGRRFELARALGHLLLDPLRGSAIGAASGPQALESRRRRSGAFAAELLLPAAALEDASNGVLDKIADEDRFRSLLERFGVGSHSAAFQLWNHGFLSSQEVRDDLIASALVGS